MSETPQSTVFPAAEYECARCHTRVSQKELESLPSPRCANCGFTVFAKVRSGMVRQVKAT
jgi:DNA-directed RNA polymerase subunit RPC12/RpoP